MRELPPDDGPGGPGAGEFRRASARGARATAAPAGRRSTRRASWSTARRSTASSSCGRRCCAARTFRRDADREAADLCARPRADGRRHAGGARDRPRRRARTSYRFSSIVLGIVRSVPFQMRMKAPGEPRSRRCPTATIEEPSCSSPRRRCPVGPSCAASGTAGAAAARRHGAGADADALHRGRADAASAPSSCRWASGRATGRRRPTGAGFEFSPILKPLEAFRDHVTVVIGPRPAAAGHARGQHRHLADRPRPSAPRPRTSSPARRSIRSSQADRPGHRVPVARDRAPRTSRGYVGACDVGYSCAYMNTISWKSPTTPMPMETNPRVVFERMFGRPGSAERAR